MYLPGQPCHIVQRGNNRQACFFEPENYQHYLSLLQTGLRRYHAELHAYVLMTNHVHLLITPESADSISRVMQFTASSYAQYLNKNYGRTGTIWEGRHKASLIDADEYLLRCQRYIELNPVRAGMVKRPEEYRWSSYGANAWGDAVELLTPHALYMSLATEQEQRLIQYRQLFEACLTETDLHEFRRAAHYCQPVGNDRFCKDIATQLGRSLGYATRGRPRQELVKK